MKFALSCAVLVASAFMVTGCATSWTGAPNGYALFKNDREPAFVTANARAPKTGRACAENWFSVVASGDASIEAAKHEGGITKVSYVDYQVKNYFVYGEICTIVRGE
jgi:hypothetical protein